MWWSNNALKLLRSLPLYNGAMTSRKFVLKSLRSSKHSLVDLIVLEDSPREEKNIRLN
jgi:hypothetical protein